MQIECSDSDGNCSVERDCWCHTSKTDRW